MAQSRQSAKLFLQSSELGLPQPLTRRRVWLPPASGGMGTLTGERGVGRVSIPTRGHHCGISLYIRICYTSSWSAVQQRHNRLHIGSSTCVYRCGIFGLTSCGSMNCSLVRPDCASIKYENVQYSQSLCRNVCTAFFWGEGIWAGSIANIGASKNTIYTGNGNQNKKFHPASQIKSKSINFLCWKDFCPISSRDFKVPLPSHQIRSVGKTLMNI
jgi:hypothetical protein